MAITATLAPKYNPLGAIYEKYRPLRDPSLAITTDEATKNIIRDIARNRVLVLSNAARNIYFMRFWGNNINGIHDLETAKGRKPPLAVISSGRSYWIKTMFEVGKSLIPARYQHFKGIDDTAPFRNGDKIPLYFPYRFSSADYGYRSVYIFVQQEEYEIYARDLAGTGITVIGYEVGMQHQHMLGFGASRYAAAKFFSHIDIPKVWFIDDNVLYIQRLSGFDVFEKRMTPDIWALGGKGLQAYLDDDKIKSIKRLKPIDDDERMGIPLFLQQAVLWDVKQLTKDNNQGAGFNYSPYFIASGEDVSITYFLGQNRCKYFNRCEVLKGSPTIHTAKTLAESNATTSIEAEKNTIRQLVRTVPSIIINNNADLWTFLSASPEFGRKERPEITFMKAGEQLLMKWMYIENQSWNWNIDKLADRLLNPMFNFTEVMYNDELALQNKQIEYDIMLIDTNPPAAV
ncbi:hypothetical protein ECE50_004315 [Chitinophaga sp. Mgbs1]|uniref:Uncharacterized protein n=1 Tax=Chitinophaga solisilvae TaxID=1233460 RepID=A0A3S1DTC0_9BACT|nr:hypothetical protein [Chitinophaga solisilvae]